VNWADRESVSAEECCEYMGKLVGIEPKFAYTENTYTSLRPDVSLMHEVLGRSKVPWKDGMHRMVQARYPHLPLREVR
jgi:hypothetical protein